VTFGSDVNGQLGHGIQESPQLVPRVVAALASQDVSGISAGFLHTCFLTSKCIGKPTNSRLQVMLLLAGHARPCVSVLSMLKLTPFFAKFVFVPICAASGEVWTCGSNVNGILGHSRHDPACNVPRRVDLPDEIIEVKAGLRHTVALSKAGEVWTWGFNGKGQLGLGNSAPEVSCLPQRVAGLIGLHVTQIAAGTKHSLALVGPDGHVYSWGTQADGVLGVRPELFPSWRHYYALGKETEPRLVTSLAGIPVAQVAAGERHSGAVTRDGRAFLWGNNVASQLAPQLEVNVNGLATPFPMMHKPDMGHVYHLALGGLHSLAITQYQGERLGPGLWGWGATVNGALGLGSLPDNRPIVDRPTRIGPIGLEYVQGVAAGYRHNLAIVGAEGRLFSWGWNGSQSEGAPIDDTLFPGALGLGHSEDAWCPQEIDTVITAGGAALRRHPAFKANTDKRRNFNWWCSNVRPHSRLLKKFYCPPRSQIQYRL